MKLQELGVLGVLLLEVAIFAAICPEAVDRVTGELRSTFLRADNLLQVGRQISFIGIAAVGATAIIVGGGIDLSVGSVIGLSGVVMGYVINAHRLDSDVAAFEPEWILVGLLAGIVAGCVSGLINGALVVSFRLPPFIATLGMLSIVRGLAFAITGGRNITQIVPKGSIAEFLGLGSIPGTLTLLPILLAVLIVAMPKGQAATGDSRSQAARWILAGTLAVAILLAFTLWAALPDVPTPMAILLWTTLAGAVLMATTRYGRAIYALGGNEEAARLSGVSTARIKMLMYGLGGLTAGLAGVLYVCRFGYCSSTAGRGYELQVIAAVVIGGTSLSGGRGTVVGALLGAAIMGVLTNGLTLMAIDEQFVELAVGAVILLAVAMDVWKSKLSWKQLILRR